jgi:putative hydrolase of the HAD superfamily
LIRLEGQFAWDGFRAVMFDLDGTLYDQRALRRCMLKELLTYAPFRPSHWMDMWALLRFRKERERLAEAKAQNVLERQFAIVADQLRLSPDRVKSVVNEWIDVRPLKHLRAVRRRGIETFFGELRRRGIRIGVLSDYPVSAKLVALGLEADATCYALEPAVGYLKPHPAGLNTLLRRLGVEPNECVFIGDREERDGVCAAALNVPFMLCRTPDFFSNLVGGDSERAAVVPARG